MKSKVLFVVALGSIVGVAGVAQATLLTAYQQAVVDAGPLAFWTFGETPGVQADGAAVHSVVNGGTYDGNAPGTTGYYGGVVIGDSNDPIHPGIGQAAYFANTDSVTSWSSTARALVPATGLPAANNARTALIWLKSNRTSNGNYYGAFEYGSGPAAGQDYLISLTGNTDPANVSGHGAGQSDFGQGFSTTTAIDDQKWHLVAVTADGSSTSKIYLDGVLNATVTMPMNTTPYAYATIGCANYLWSSAGAFDKGVLNWDGGIADVAVFDTALSGAQIGSLYNASLVPEPSTCSLLGVGIVSLLAYAWRKRR